MGDALAAPRLPAAAPLLLAALLAACGSGVGAEEVTWTMGAKRGNCISACQDKGLFCSEEHWPSVPNQMRRIASMLNVNCSKISQGGVIYDPSYAYDHCGWKGAFYDYTTRCEAKPTSASTTRFCPCVDHLPAFDCKEGYNPLNTDWTSDKRRWCCRYMRRGCSDGISVKPYDCSDGLAREWSDSKKVWCCTSENKGCEWTTSAPFDCSAGYNNWQMGWSLSKMDWCCGNLGLGCRNTTYEFVGFGTAYEARTLCSGDGYIGMPMTKTPLQKHELQEVMHSAVAKGQLGSDWPQNTIWLGAHWQEGHGHSRGQWVWEDDTPVDKKLVVENQLNAGTKAPFLCLLPGGAWHEALARYTFGVICEKKLAQSLLV